MSRKGIMLCYPFEDKRLATWSPPYIVQPKLDGERCRAFLQPEPIMLSSEENLITSCPHILAEMRELVKEFPQLVGLELDGENYVHGTARQDIHSIISRKTGALHDDYEDVKLHVFDVVFEGIAQHTRIQALHKLDDIFLNHCTHITVVPSIEANTLDEVNQLFERYIRLGYEGIVIRNRMADYVRRRSPWIMKFKPKKTDVYQIVGIQEEISIEGKPKNSLGALNLVGSDGTLFNVGTGFTREQRKDLWTHKVIGKWAKINYQAKSNDGIPCHSVFVTILEQPVSEEDFGVEVPEIWT